MNCFHAEGAHLALNELRGQREDQKAGINLCKIHNIILILSGEEAPDPKADSVLERCTSFSCFMAQRGMALQYDQRIKMSEGTLEGELKTCLLMLSH